MSHVLRRVLLSLANPRLAQEPLEGAAYLSMVALRDGGWSAMYPSSYESPGEPLVLTPYPPLFHLLWWLTAALTGADATYTPGRIVANLALIAIVVLIYACARQVGVGRVISAVFSGLFLLPVPVAQWAGVARVDVPAIAFALAGLWLYLRFRDDPDGHRYLFSAVPIVLAGLTKQSLIAVPAAIVFAELLARRYRRALVFATATAGTVLAVFVTLDVLTDGGFFDATVTSLADEFFVTAGIVVALRFLVTSPLIVALLLLTSSLLRFARRRDAIVLFYAATSYGVLALTIGKPGSNVNYFIEPIAALCLCGAVGLARWQERRRAGAAVTLGFAGLIVWSVLSLLPDYHEAYRSHAATVRRSGLIELPPEALSGPVLVPASLALLVKPPPVYYVNDTYTVGVVAAWGELLSTERIVDDLRNQRLGAVIAWPLAFREREDGPRFVGDWQRGWNFWSVEPFRVALFEAYEPLDRPYPFGVVVLLPKAVQAVPEGPER